MRRILPLCTIDDIKAELADTDRSLMRLTDFPVIDEERRNERLDTLRRWKSQLEEQLADMQERAA